MSSKTRYFQLVVGWTLICFLVCSVAIKVQSSNNLLMDDLNIIASKINEIPETSLGIKLVLVTFECSEVRLFWNIQTTSSNRKKVDKNSLKIDQKIFGYQVVVQEYLTSKKLNKERKARLFSSKYIDPTQNRFKLINMIREDEGHYLICLVIYVDVIETVAFEKQCLTLYLPKLSEPFNQACQAINYDRGIKSNTNKDINDRTNTFKFNSNFHPRVILENNTHSTQEGISRNSHIITPNFEHLTKCRHYNNLLIVFVVCGILLMSNIFMFTIIMIQNPFKKQIVKDNKVFPKIQEHSSAYQLTNKFRPDVTKLNDETFSVSELSLESGNRGKKKDSESASSRSCLFFVASFCYSFFKKTSKTDSLSNKKCFNKKELNLMRTGCKIRPSYIISLPDESNKMKEKIEYFEKKTKRIDPRNKDTISNLQSNWPARQDLDLRHFENYDNEIFYHLPKKSRNITSAQ